MKTTYNKLVRDRIPDIIRQAGNRPATRIAADAELPALLEEKLVEELAELQEPGANRAEELADILEVVLAMAAREGLSPGQLYALRHKKRDERGGFDDGVVLEWVEE